MKKFILFVFSLIIGLAVFCGLNVKATGIALTMTDGASVRTTGEYQGLRFLASVDTLEGSSEHGFYIALGEHSLSDMRTAIEANAEIVGSYKLVKRQALGEDTTFAVTIYDIPNTYYVTGITAVAYVKVGDDYALDKAVTRNIAEVSLGALQDGNDSTLVKSVVNHCYYSVNFSSKLNKYVAGNSVYENLVDNLWVEFLADWSANAASHGGSINTSTVKTIFSSSNKDEIRTFALEDNEGARKWHWLWEYLYSLNTTPYRNEIKDLAQDNAEVDNDNGYTILYVTYNFFFGGSWKVDIANESVNDREIRFWNHPEYYAQVGNYNNTIEADHENINTIYVLKGETFELPAYTLVEKDYYTVTGWNDGTSSYASGSSYTLSAPKIFQPIYTANTYTVTYMDGEANISELFASSYRSFTIESSALTLPTYEKDGFVFEGWYDNAGFAGSAAATIPEGSHENKVFYAKTTESSNVSVNITYDLNGGVWKLAQVENFDTPLQTFNIDYYRTYDSSNGYHVSLTPNQGGSAWKYIVLQKSVYEGFYEIKEIVDARASITVPYDLVITWHSALQDEDAKAKLTSIYNNSAAYLNKYVVFEGIPAASATSTTSASIVAKFYSSINAGYNTSYIIETVLPTPIKPGYIFAGWRSSIDSNDYTVFPGYTSNPGDIIYTAQWTEASTLTIEAIRTQFLNDLNTLSGLSATAETFYSTYKEKLVVNSSGETTGYIINNAAFRAKYMWLFEYAVNHGIRNKAEGNKFMAYAASTLGIEYYGTTNATTSDIKYSDRAFTNTIYNILNDVAITDKTLTGSTYALPNPNVVSPYADLISFAEGAGFELPN